MGGQSATDQSATTGDDYSHLAPSAFCLTHNASYPIRGLFFPPLLACQAPTSLRRIPKFGIIHKVKEQRTLRPIEALAESGSLLNRRIWLILLPIGLDLLIWLAPRVILGEELFPLAEGSTSAFDEGTDTEDLTIFSLLRSQTYSRSL